MSRSHQQGRFVGRYTKVFPQMHLFHRFGICDKEQRHRRVDQFAYFTTIPDQFPVMKITDRARSTAGNLLVMAELNRPFADKPRMILPSKKRGAVHDLLMVTARRTFSVPVRPIKTMPQGGRTRRCRSYPRSRHNHPTPTNSDDLYRNVIGQS